MGQTIEVDHAFKWSRPSNIYLATREDIGYIVTVMDLAVIIQRLVILVPPILLAVTVHEMAHGWVAYRLGDPTAKMLGRLSFNPLRHLDPIGTLVFFLTQTIGWARPVPINPVYFKYPRRDMVWVSIAGPAANMTLAAISAFLLRAAPGFLGGALESSMYFVRPLVYMAYVSIQLNIGLAVFNLIPIPPLDGSKVLMGFLPLRFAVWYGQLERYGFIIILILVFTGVTGRIIVPLIIYLNNIFLGIAS